MDVWEIVAFLALSVVQLLGLGALFFITRQGQDEDRQGKQGETLASLTEKHHALRTEFDTSRRADESDYTNLASEQAKMKDQIGQIAGQLSTFSAEHRGQLAAINDRLGHRDDRLAQIEGNISQMATTLRDMGIQMATLFERWQNLGPARAGSTPNPVFNDAEARVIRLLSPILRDLIHDEVRP